MQTELKGRWREKEEEVEAGWCCVSSDWCRWIQALWSSWNHLKSNKDGQRADYLFIDLRMKSLFFQSVLFLRTLIISSLVCWLDDFFTLRRPSIIRQKTFANQCNERPKSAAGAPWRLQRTEQSTPSWFLIYQPKESYSGTRTRQINVVRRAEVLNPNSNLNYKQSIQMFCETEPTKPDDSVNQCFHLKHKTEHIYYFLK